MHNRFLEFESLHHSDEPLLIANAWNAQSARAFERLHYRAIATSSAAIAETLGYADGEQMSFDEYFLIIKHIVRSTSLPVSVDLEAGYGHSAENVAENIRRLVSIGVVGINIEDSVVVDGNRSLTAPLVFTHRLLKIVEVLKAYQCKIFINVRCDAFLLGVPNAVDEAKKRSALYSTAGVHGLFLPCITDSADIEAMVNTVQLPLNVMCMPGLPGFQQLKKLGVKRISMGNFMNQVLYNRELEKMAKRVIDQESFASLFQ